MIDFVSTCETVSFKCLEVAENIGLLIPNSLALFIVMRTDRSEILLVRLGRHQNTPQRPRLTPRGMRLARL